MLDLEFYAPVAFSSSFTARFGIPTLRLSALSSLHSESCPLRFLVLFVFSRLGDSCFSLINN